MGAVKKIMSIKPTLRQIAAWAFHSSQHYLRRLRGKALILTYHRVLSEKELNQQYVQPGMYVREDVFETQMRFVKEHFRVLPFIELVKLWDRKTWDEGQRYCVITFDDGWVDNYLYAYPILRNYNLPATIFLATEFIGTDNWFWPEKLNYLLRHANRASGNATKVEWMTALQGKVSRLKQIQGQGEDERIDSLIEHCKGMTQKEIEDLIERLSTGLGVRLPAGRLLLDWEEIREMSEHGVSFGSHSSTHRILTKLASQEIQTELEGSCKTLRQKRVNDIPVFCYPNGNYSPEVSRCVKAAGYQAAVTTRFGLEDAFPQDLFGLKRVGIHNDICSTIPLFTFHICGLNHLRSFVS